MSIATSVFAETAATRTQKEKQQTQEPESRAIDVFLSHASEDTKEARILAQAIRSHGLSVWLDVEHDIPTQRWTEEIENALRRSRAIVLLISLSTKPRGRLSREWSEILGRSWDEPEIPILPVVLDEVDPPNFLGERRYFASNRNPADLEQAADIIVRFMASPESVVESLKFKPADPKAWEERFRILRQAIQGLKDLELSIERPGVTVE